MLPHVCCKCGVGVAYPGRGPRHSLLCDGCKKRTGRRPCARCGKEFADGGMSAFCSKLCRRPDGILKPIPCKECGTPFIRRKHSDAKCSEECRTKGRRRRSEKAAEVLKANAKKYTCLNCGVLFQRRRYKSGSVSCQKKYCSRGCAFEARRLKKECAKRPVGKLAVAKRLAFWFLSWGDDVWPIVSPCVDCGAALLRSNESFPAKEKCHACEAVRWCADCGVKVNKGRKRCGKCAKGHAKRTSRASRRKQRQTHGNWSTIRRRCRRAGAPYTIVSRKAILDRDDWTCQLCGVPLLRQYTRLKGGGVDPRSPTLDHIIPLARGPEGPGHVESNCQAACWGCNTEKGARDPHSFVPQKATDVEFSAWQKDRPQHRSTSSRCEAARRRTTGKNSVLL